MRSRRTLAWGFAGAALLGLLAAGVILIRAPLAPSPRGPEPGRAIFQAHCASCHGASGRGDSWRARLLFLRPGDLSSPVLASLPDQYLADLIRHGGSTFGKPGMPSFGFVLGDAEIEAVIHYVRSLPRAPRDLGRRETPPAAVAPDRTAADAGPSPTAGPEPARSGGPACTRRRRPNPSRGP